MVIKIMKLWHKIFVSIFVIFTITFNVGVFYITSYSYNFNRERERENAIREQQMIQSSIENRIISAEALFPNIANANLMLATIVSSLSDFYEPQGVLLALFNENGDIIHNDMLSITIDNQLLIFESTSQKNTMEETINNKRHIVVASILPEYPHLTFVYARDISQIDDFRSDISRVFAFVNVIVLIFLGISVYLLLRHIIKPIINMKTTVAEIADGAYNKRVVVNSRDELGALANSFNRMADSVEENMKQLTKASEEKQQFIDDLTHEIKTPLTSILGYSEYLQFAKYTENERIIATGYLYETAMRLNTLSDKLLDLTYSRDENIEKKALDTRILFEDLTAMVLPVLAPRNIKLDTSVDLPEITGDETLLLAMLRNLVENAARASADGSLITVRAYKEKYPILEVSDKGCGMEQKDVERIMAPFYRVDKSRSRKFGGVGLGLSIVSQIASLHGAKVNVVSVPNVGTTVKISFTSS
ncbi:MAG: HAMP domain-containing histidine kinase [Oscillospiraceae bacterium]|jgi:signal transduction histidine kinase|nr:HAMP domain-containing histidine kinase [Oscillospiraceae bacterium]